MQLRQPCTDTAVDAVAEGDMAASVLAREIELVGVLEHLLVAIGRQIPQNDLLAFLDGLAEHLGVLGAGTPHMRQRSLHAEHFLHRIGDHVGVLLEQLALLGVFVELVDEAAHRIARGVVAAHDQQDQIAHEFLRAHLVHRLGVDHHRDEIVTRLLVVRALDPQRLEIGRHFIEEAPA